jgi:hypothetical protein
MLWPIGTQVAKLAAMRPSSTRFSLACLAVIISSFAMIRCGGGGESSDSLPETAAGTIRDIGNMNFSCGGHGGGDGSSHSGQNKQVQFQQQSGGGCDQKVQFEEQKVSDLDVNLDCDQKVVSVKNQGADQKQETLPISRDGTVHGQLHFQSKIKGPQQSGQNDGQNCWVEYVVSFNGKTDCDSGSNQNANMKLSTQVAFQQTTVARLAEAGIPGATPTPSRETRSGMSEASHSGEHRSPITSGPDTSNPDPVATWTPEPGISGSPSSAPTGSPTARPSYSPTSSPTASPSITPSPSPSLIPVVVCAVQNPCTVTSNDEDFSCGQ